MIAVLAYAPLVWIKGVYLPVRIKFAQGWKRLAISSHEDHAWCCSTPSLLY